jgi:beta-glucosidase
MTEDVRPGRGEMSMQQSGSGRSGLARDVTPSVDERVDDLVSRMTLEEKIAQMVYDAPAIERLDIPAYNWWNECLHGVGRAGVATVFPQAIGLAATWNVELMHRVATAISDEARAKHHEALRRGIRAIYAGLTYWSPNINIFRDPRWGRGQETYGEDPYLTTRMGVAFVRGLQGDDPTYLKLVATPKHYAVHSGPEPDRHRFDARVGERDLRETYLPAFEACVKEGGAVSVMGAYNRTNGEPCCASPTLLEQVLRQEWGFGGPTGSDGYVVSDCWAILDIHAHHRVTGTAAEAAALAVWAGCDLNCGSTYPALREAVEHGLIDEASIDQAVKRLFTARLRLGMFDPPERVSYAQIPYEIVDSPGHRALALQAARESIVLLKNEGGFLPLQKEIASLAIVGPLADDRRVLLGNYNGTPARATTVLEGIRRKVPPATRLYTAPGCLLAEGVPLLSVIPSTYLRPTDTADLEGGSYSQMGLAGAYYTGQGMEGEPALVRVDPVVDLSWPGASPLTGGWGDAFSVRWDGFLVPPVAGTYRLGVNGYNDCDLYLDDQLVARYWGNHHAGLDTAEVDLEAGRLYPLRLDYVSRHLDPQVQLLWAVPGVDQAAQALHVAERADVVIAVLGLSPSLEGEEMPIQIEGFFGGDRTDIDLPRPQKELLKQIHALGKPTVLVLLNGSALSTNWAVENVPAIVEAWYPGQAGGDAIADVLFGDYNPGGRLPVTCYRSIADLPPFADYTMEGRTYRFFQGEPLFPFGHGLSYSHFEYSDLEISPSHAAASDTVTIRMKLRNIGDRDGDEVVQLYVRDVASSVPQARQQLRGFRRVHVPSGQQKTITLLLPVRDLAFYDEAQEQFVVEPGEFEIRVGASSSDIRLTGSLHVG